MRGRSRDALRSDAERHDEPGLHIWPGVRNAAAARRSDGSLRWCSACNSSCTVEAATSPWWTEPDGVLARVRGDADVVREIVSLKGL